MDNYCAIYTPNPDCSFTRAGFTTSSEALEYVNRKDIGGVPVNLEAWLITNTEALIKRLQNETVL